MSHEHDMNVTQMYWQPPLLRLTYVGHPEVDDGGPTVCFVAPQLISGIVRQTLSFGKVAGHTPPEPQEQHPIITVTGVALTTGQVYYITESPDEVATLRDRALGHEPPKPSAPLAVIGTILM